MDYLSSHKSNEQGVLSPNRAALFKDYHNLHGVWTHPWRLEQKPKDTENSDSDDTENLEDESENSPESLNADDHNMRKLTFRFLNTFPEHIIPTLRLKQVILEENPQAMMYQLVGGNRYATMAILMI